MRASASVAPPGAKGAIIRTVLVGYSWAVASAVRPANVHDAISAAKERMVLLRLERYGQV
jgi:hypothetical protein